MRFQNPQFAPFLLAVLIPILLHLRSRQTGRTLTLPTFRFVQQAIAEQAKTRKVRQWLLLVLRMASVVLLVGVFLKPVRTAPLSQTGNGRRVVVAVLDQSLSMQAASGGVTAWAREKAECELLLDTLQPQDRANIILARRAPQSVLARPGSDRAVLLQALEMASPTNERGDMAAALRLAKEQLESGRNGQKELWLFSDFQRTNWANAEPNEIGKNVKFAAVKVGKAQSTNAAVTELRFDAASPTAGEPAEVVATIWNDADTPRSLPVTLTCPELDLKQTQASPTLAPHGSGSVTFRIAFPQTQVYRLVASVPADELAADNARFLAADLRQGLRVILLTDDAGNSLRAAYWIQRALHPNPNASGGIRVLTKAAAALTETDLQTCDALLFADVRNLPAGSVAMLARFITNGGIFVGFLTNDAALEQFAALNAAMERGERLPFVPQIRLDVGTRGKRPISFAEARYRSPLLQLFREASVGDLGKAKFRRFFLTDQPDDKTETLIAYEDGTPAAAKRVVGAGSVLLCNFSPAPDDSDFAKQSEFVLLLHEFLNGITGENRERRESMPGGSAAVSVDAAKGKQGTVQVTAPSGKAESATADSSGSVLIDRVDELGFHSVQINGKTETVFAVNAAPEESDLRSLETQNWMQDGKGTAVGGVAGDVESLRQERPLWQGILLGAMLLLICEQAVSLRARRPPRRT